MATLETLRNRAGVFVAIAIGLALLAFILGDFSQGGSVFSSNDMSVGSVNGISLDYPDFQRSYDTKLNIYQSASSGGDQEMLSEQLRNQVWESFVSGQIYSREYDRLGLGLTPEELSARIVGKDPHPIVKQLFVHPSTGDFSPEQVVAFLQSFDQATAQQRAYWLEAEQEIESSLIAEKYQALVVKGLGITHLEVAFQDSLNANSVDAAYIYRSFSSEPDSLHRVTVSEAKDYYKRNREKYRAETRRDLIYVQLDAKPADRDYEASRVEMEKLAPEFASAEDVKVYAQQVGDNLGKSGWQKPSDLPGSLASWVEGGAGVGGVSGVVRDGDAYYMARLLGRKEMADSAHARHILFSGQKYGMAEAQRLADSIADLVRKGGDFSSFASEYSDDPGSKSKGGDLDWFPQGMMVPEFNDACFGGKKGDVVVVGTQFGVHVIEVLGHKGSSEFIDVALLGRRVEAGSETRQELFNKASALASRLSLEHSDWFWAGVKDGMKGEVAVSEMLELRFDSLVQEAGLSKRLAANVEADWSRISGISNSREVVRWAYEAEVGDVSQVFELVGSKPGVDDVFVVAMLQRVRESEDGYASFDAVRGDVERDARLEKKAQSISQRFASAFASGKDISAVAQEFGEGVRQASSVSFNGYSFGQEGFEPKAVGAGSALYSGQVVPAIVGNGGVFAMVCESVQPNSSSSSGDRKSLQDGLRRNAGYGLMGSLKELSTIKDNRARFF